MDIDRSLILRFANKISYLDNGCWEWQGVTAAGYGKMRVKYKRVPAHRIAYQIFRGDIPEGMEIDHLCRNTKCVNPMHIEAVTHTENVRRGIGGINNKLKTHCPQGHEYIPSNVYLLNGSRYCRRCRNERMQHKRAASRQS